MATRKQIAANRRNAKKSTGPRTPEGKAASARNATKHGLLSRTPLLADENESEFVELRIQIHGELAPMGALETVLVNRIAAQQWRLARIPALEAELFERMRYDALGNDQGLGAAWARDAEPYGGALARLSRYETMLERNGARLLGELRRLQTQRRTTDQRQWQAEQQAQGPWWERAEAAWPGGPTGAAQELARPTDETPPRTADAVPPLPVHGEGAGGGVPRQAPNVGLPPGWPGPTPEERAADQARAAAYAARQAPSFGGDRTAPAGRGEAPLRNEADSSGTGSARPFAEVGSSAPQAHP
jgi:hypothetical protein